MQDTITGRDLNLDHLKRSRVLRGHRFISGALALGVSLCPALLGASTRVEETDPGLTFTGAWAPDTVGVHSAGAAVVSDQSGARATVTFAGTGITWIGDAGFNRGVARVYLDGTANTVDTYSLVWQDQHILFVAKGLTAGLHTLSIEVTQMRNVNAQASGVSVDAFDIENGAVVTGSVAANPGYIEQNNSAVTFTGNWYLNTAPEPAGVRLFLPLIPAPRRAFNSMGQASPGSGLGTSGRDGPECMWTAF
jgi:hypothetical protein